MWTILPARQEDGQDQIHKSRQQMMYLILGGLNLATAITATVLLMPGAHRPVLTSLPPGPLSFLPISEAAQEFLILGGAPSLLCHLISCILLISYYRCSHTWRSIGTERDLKSCCWCPCPCPSIGRLCYQRNPILGEIPFWEQVRGTFKLHSIFSEEGERHVQVSELAAKIKTTNNVIKVNIMQSI